MLVCKLLKNCIFVKQMLRFLCIAFDHLQYDSVARLTISIYIGASSFGNQLQFGCTKFHFNSIYINYYNLLYLVQLLSLINQQTQYLMNKRTYRRNIETPEINKISNGLNKLEETLIFQQSICGSQNCDCLICQSKKIFKKRNNEHIFQQSSIESDDWLLRILTGLTNKDGPTLKIYIPDIVFIDGDSLKVFFTDVKDNRIKRMDGSMPTKALYLIMLRLKKQYKEMLEQKFQKSILNEINPQFVHQKYMQHVLPSSFNDSQQSTRLHGNKMKFRKYVFHKNEKLLIQSIQQHKLNENQPFCSVRYKDGNMQLFSKKQFQNSTVTRINPDIIFVQSYIKEKQETKAHFTSVYSFVSNQTDIELFNRAQREILILIGGIGKYSEAYQDIENFQDATIQLMNQDIQAYIKYMTYKIVHYLAMVSRIYVKHIKINWILNDMKMVYILNVFQFQTTEISLRNLKYRLPPKQQNLVFYKDSQNFINLYKQIQVFREARRLKIRSDILKQREEILKKELQTEKSTLQQTQSIRLSQLRTARKKKVEVNRNSKTISAVVNYRHDFTPQKKQKDAEDRYDNGAQIKMTAFEKKRRERYKSVLEKYVV